MQNKSANKMMWPEVKPRTHDRETCDHCYCQSISVNGKDHLMCCNCGNKKVSIQQDSTYICKYQ